MLVPVFDVFLCAARRAANTHHLIFACHVLAAFFAVQSIAVAAGYLSANATVKSVLGLGSLLYAFVYLILALRAYGGSTARAAAHTIVVLAFYWLATILVAAAIIAPVLFWN